MKKSHLLSSVFLAAFLLTGGIVPVFANDEALDDTIFENDEIVLTDAEALQAGDMEEERGGFRDPTGMIYRFAVDVRTHVDGVVSYARSLVIEPGAQGHLQATSTIQMQEAPNLPVGTIANIIENGQSLVVNDSEGNKTVANVIDNGKGIVVDDNKGRTTILNQTPTGALASVIMNTANNRVVSQTMDINIVVRNLANLAAHRAASSNISALAQSLRMRTLGFGR